MQKAKESFEKLRRLYRLRWIEGIKDKQTLAMKLGISISELQNYLLRLRRMLEEGSKESSYGLCPECLSSKIVEDPETGEVICRSCGYVIEKLPNLDFRLPFGTTYALESPLAVGKSLGGTITRQGLYRILAKSAAGTEDLGIRARHIRIMIETNDPPDLARILKIGNNLIKKFNLENEKLLANDLGRNIRRAYWLITQLVVRVPQKRIAETALYVTLRQRKRKAKKYREILKNIKPNTQLYNLMNKLNEIIQQLKDETAVLKVANDET